jgi:hypothetical protein
MLPGNQDLTKNAVKTFVTVPVGPLGLKENDPAAASVVKARPEHLAPDPRRQIAQMAAKARWAAWAGKKAL